MRPDRVVECILTFGDLGDECVLAQLTDALLDCGRTDEADIVTSDGLCWYVDATRSSLAQPKTVVGVAAKALGPMLVYVNTGNHSEREKWLHRSLRAIVASWLDDGWDLFYRPELAQMAYSILDGVILLDGLVREWPRVGRIGVGHAWLFYTRYMAEGRLVPRSNVGQAAASPVVQAFCRRKGTDTQQGGGRATRPAD